MRNFFLKYKAFVFGLLALLFFAPLFNVKEKKHTNTKHTNELFNKQLLVFNSVPKAIDFLNYVNKLKNDTPFDTVAYVNSTSDFIKQRFSFGLANYSYADNWIAVASAHLFWEHFSAIVNPDDILKQDVGICSQQTIVFLEILKQKKINVRTVGLGNQITGPGHFICEVNYNGKWHMYDVSKEPNWNEITDKHFSVEHYITQQDLFSKIYGNKLPEKIIQTCFNEVAYGKTNEFPAKNMLLFHKTTLFITYLLPILFLILFFKEIIKKNKMRTKT